VNPVEFIRKHCGLELRDFQTEWLNELFLEKAGERVYSQALWGIPRGNGKTEIAAAVALYMLVLDTRRAEVYIAAGSRDQATLAFKAARRMVEQGDLSGYVRVLPGYRKMEVPSTDSSLHVIAADAPLQHGLQPSCVIFDELWVQKKRDLFEALAGGLFKRDRAMLVCISTAGFDPNSLLAEECRRGEKGEDPRFFYSWHGAQEELPFDDPRTWELANPALSCEKPFMRVKGLEDDLRRMHEAEFRRWHLNQWTGAEDTWISADLWDQCDGSPSLSYSMDTILGVDASIRRDATAVATVQRHPDGIYHAEFKIWEPTPNREVPLEAVMNHIREQCGTYQVTGVCYDPQFLHHMSQRLDDEGIPMIEWRQDNARMVPATRTLHEAVVQGKLRHGGHKIVREHALNAGVKETERGLRIKKTSSSGPDDSIVALAMAVEWASRQEPPRRSVYEDRFSG
jgi:phage terminase large subunit-like protein